ncbi:MAG TPA: transcription elongation factor GreA [Oligoflexia bacterium]|nr:transcription elongation factor GreA [Oligoflexia bacterium]HMP49093.1 transcription elongation factor GreA [Oligoflexia bacterium]
MKSPMTNKSYEFLKEELQRLKGIERPKASKAIEIARAHGDLSENAEYDAAKEAQGMLEARIRDIEGKVATAQVVDISTLSGTKVIFGATVELEDADSGDKRTITIVGEDEADVEKGLISFQSPLARALIGKEVGDLAKVKLPSGEKEYEVMDLRFVPT